MWKSSFCPGIMFSKDLTRKVIDTIYSFASRHEVQDLSQLYYSWLVSIVHHLRQCLGKDAAEDYIRKVDSNWRKIMPEVSARMWENKAVQQLTGSPMGTPSTKYHTMMDMSSILCSIVPHSFT